MPQVPRHKAFISFHHEDQKYKDRFAQLMENNIVDKSVGDGDIDKNTKVDTIRQRIRDDFIADATVTVVLIGPCTWQRKHVDWEIGSSLRDTDHNPRCGLLGILLPNHPDFGKKKEEYNPRLIPPRLADNCEGILPFARIYKWEEQTKAVRKWIHRAFQRRDRSPHPDNAREQFENNWRGDCRKGRQH